MFNFKSLIFLTGGFVLGIYTYKHKDKITEYIGDIFKKSKTLENNSQTETENSEVKTDEVKEKN